MIELLMTITIIAILGATALPNFLDFRKEAKAAAVRQMLATMRSGIKNQIQQAQLKCNMGANLQGLNSGNFQFGFLLGDNMGNNDITTNSGVPGRELCSTSQIPNLEDRKFWNDMPDSQRAHHTDGASDFGPSGFIFRNPFLVENGTGVVWPLAIFNNSSLALFGGMFGGGANVCNLISYYSIILSSKYHWLYNSDTGEIFAGTNTAGIRECAF